MTTISATKNNTFNQHQSVCTVTLWRGYITCTFPCKDRDHEQVARTVMTGHNWYKVMSNELEPAPSQPVVYQIRIKGHLGSQWTDWFGGLTITLEDNGYAFNWPGD